MKGEMFYKTLVYLHKYIAVIKSDEKNINASKNKL